MLSCALDEASVVFKRGSGENDFSIVGVIACHQISLGVKYLPMLKADVICFTCQLFFVCR